MALFSDLYNVGVPTTSADLAIRVSDETGTGNLVFNTNPAFGGSILHNGVEHFTQSSPPSQRSDGSPLVDGDRWHKNDDGTSWFWNGTYWLETVLRGTEPSGSNSSLTPNSGEGLRYKSVTGFSPILDYLSANAFVEEMGIYTLPTQSANLKAGDINNHVVYRFGYFSNATSFQNFYTIKSNEIVQSPTALRVDSYKVTVNQALLDFRAFNTVITIIGTGGGGVTSLVRIYATYRNIYL